MQKMMADKRFYAVETNSGWDIMDGERYLFEIGGNRTFGEAERITEQVLIGLNDLNENKPETLSALYDNPDLYAEDDDELYMFDANANTSDT